MARYIDADRLRDRVKTQTNPYGNPTLEYASGLKVLTMIDNEPTADVAEVVRCKDCKHRRQPSYPKYAQPECALLNAVVKDDFYCAKGIRTPQKEG